jgi:hypothetical protein
VLVQRELESVVTVVSSRVMKLPKLKSRPDALAGFSHSANINATLQCIARDVQSVFSPIRSEYFDDSFNGDILYPRQIRWVSNERARVWYSTDIDDLLAQRYFADINAGRRFPSYQSISELVAKMDQAASAGILPAHKCYSDHIILVDELEMKDDIGSKAFATAIHRGNLSREGRWFYQNDDHELDRLEIAVADELIFPKLSPITLPDGNVVSDRFGDCNPRRVLPYIVDGIQAATKQG